jgi:hypothetical protein
LRSSVSHSGASRLAVSWRRAAMSCTVRITARICVSRMPDSFRAPE